MSKKPWVRRLVAVWASTETKASQAGQIIASAAAVPLNLEQKLREIDRSSTGYLATEEHSENTGSFYAQPTVSARGWERAVDAQSRITTAVDEILGVSPPGDVAVIAHGAVGTLLLCHLKGVPIARAEDQPGQGHAFSFGRRTHTLHHGWVRIEDLR